MMPGVNPYPFGTTMYLEGVAMGVIVRRYEVHIFVGPKELHHA
jgi:hypothetical protein